MSASIPKGRFVWADLMTNDVEAAIRFYAAVAGWGTQQWEGPMAYTMWTANGAPIGGVMPLPEPGEHPNWLGYTSTPDVDASAREAESLGAKIQIPPQDIPSVGRFSVLTDPQGAWFALYSSGDVQGHDTEPAIGEFSWHELATSDGEAALAFYSQLFGWDKLSSFDMGSGWMYHLFGRAGRELGGMFTKTSDMQFPPMWIHYIKVDSANAAADRITKAGGQVINGPMEVPGGDWITQALDPQGAMFAVHSKGK
jgi:hypothetical protein